MRPLPRLRVAQVVETSLMRSLHHVVYPWLLARCADDERRFADALARARSGRRKDISVPKYACDLDAATRSAADALRRAGSPLDKLLCMKRITSELTRDVERTYERGATSAADQGAPPELATDDLIDLIVHLFVSHRDPATVPHLPTDLKYVQMFHFVEVSTSALGFFLSNFEVANDFLLDRDHRADADALESPTPLPATRPPKQECSRAPEADRPDTTPPPTPKQARDAGRRKSPAATILRASSQALADADDVLRRAKHNAGRPLDSGPEQAAPPAP